MVSMDTRVQHCISLEFYFVVAAHMKRTVLRSSDDSCVVACLVLCLILCFTRDCEGTWRMRKLH